MTLTNQQRKEFTTKVFNKFGYGSEYQYVLFCEDDKLIEICKIFKLI